jgi:exonuclease III
VSYSVLKPLSLNINGNVNKLDLHKFIQFSNQYDIIAIQEVKCNYKLEPSGFKTLRSLSMEEENLHGGVAVLFSHKV